MATRKSSTSCRKTPTAVRKTTSKSTSPRRSTKAATTPKSESPVTTISNPEPLKTVPSSTDAAPVDAPEASVVTTMKKKEMIAKVAEASGVKRSDAKKVLEAVLAELGDALQRGDELNLPPLGKVSVNRQREGSGAHIVIAKLRRPKAMMAGTEEGDVSDVEATETEAAES